MIEGPPKLSTGPREEHYSLKIKGTVRESTDPRKEIRSIGIV
jgi:hypothetical protein